ncbi:dihydrodipicolinate synthase family protein [Pontibacillus yanchengensis]|uniref:Dihydrodipicolinate synthase family protein n=2 Tax=Pontibacillus yanchengensis TaxID=462910 RepID=A0ACC7VIA1_9BACI|nr:dihydrodipicolinate synthase family protein [Pontibacillus yanchengensis]MYL33889.1 dihydrodipicolinate synthase family protein [Pontibacillus yanchengensis]MYL53914.1 dihydrodipicolinate synthase family protein [Pontibacillus yanchengensis]
MLQADIKKALHDGTVIPAHPLALNEDRTLDEQSQRALTRYYMDAGAGGIAVGVHTTQFEIREHGLYEYVLSLAMEEISTRNLKLPFIKIAGICGPTEQAVEEAKLAKGLGYDLGLLSMGGLQRLSEEELIERTRAVAEVMPVFGFYLQPSVGGRVLSYDFWRAFADIPNVHAIKMAPFNRYQTIDVARAVCHSNRRDDIALYTGNDDTIVSDLLTTYRFPVHGELVEKSIVGGLLGHWAVWTTQAVELFKQLTFARQNQTIPSELLTIAQQVTETNAVLFDAKHDFKGCIAGINEVLARQGLLKGAWCLSPDEVLSPGQAEEIDRIYREYPHLTDDAFVADHLPVWKT